MVITDQYTYTYVIVYSVLASCSTNYNKVAVHLHMLQIACQINVKVFSTEYYSTRMHGQPLLVHTKLRKLMNAEETKPVVI